IGANYLVCCLSVFKFPQGGKQHCHTVQDQAQSFYNTGGFFGCEHGYFIEPCLTSLVKLLPLLIG
ncbi:MAG TPA: hypothetical protein PLR98_15765, partial [Chitinophagaceae bacterium]|nr:hypothetical protein [Chitinophagaceae bacterium]